MDIFEQLENLNISEECFDDILSIIEEYINETITVGKVKSAVQSALPLRMQRYKDAKTNPASTPQDIKKASDRVEKAMKIKSGLSNNISHYDNISVHDAKNKLSNEIKKKENEEGYSGAIDTSKPYKWYDSDTGEENTAYDRKYPKVNRSASISKRQNMLTALNLLKK